MIQIKYAGGNWPTTKETQVSNSLQMFVNFVKPENLKKSAMIICIKERRTGR